MTTRYPLVLNGTSIQELQNSDSLILPSALSISSGGTGLSSYTAGDLSYYASGTALTKLAIGTSGYLLTSSGTAPQWSNSISIGAGTFTSLTDSGLTSGRVTYVGTGGLLQDSANLTFSGSALAVTGTLSATSNANFGNNGSSTYGGYATGGRVFSLASAGGVIPAISASTDTTASSTAIRAYTKEVANDTSYAFDIQTGNGSGVTTQKLQLTWGANGLWNSTGLAVTGKITATTTASINSSFALDSLTLGGSAALGANSATTGDFLSSGGGNNSTYNGLAIISNARGVGTQANTALPSWIVDIGGRGADGSTFPVTTANKFRVAYVAAGTSFYSGKDVFSINSNGLVGFGTNGPTSDRLMDASFSGAVTAGATQFGMVLNPTYPNTATANLYNLYTAANVTSGATLTNAYGLFIDSGNYPGSTVSNKWGLYQAGANEKNYFAGPTNFGSSSTTSTTYIVQAYGSGVGIRCQDGTNSMAFGQWDGTTNRFESSGRKLLITSYTGGIDMGINGSGGAVFIDTSNKVIMNDTATQYSAQLYVNGSIAARNGGVDGTYQNAFVAGYTSNYNEQNIIQTAVSSSAPGSGFLFKVSDGGGSSSTTSMFQITRQGISIIGNANSNLGALMLNCPPGTQQIATGVYSNVTRGSGVQYGYTFYRDSAGETSGVTFVENASSGNNAASYVVRTNAATGGGGVTNVSGGVALVNGATSWSSYSDLRLKHDVVPVTNAIESILKIDPIFFKWNDRPADQQRSIGVSAQSVEKVFPELIDRSGIYDVEGGAMQVRYTELIPVLLASIQEQQAIIESLKARLDAANF